MAFGTKYLRFGGGDERVTMGDVLAFEHTNSFSFSFWFRSSAVDGPVIWSKVGASPLFRGYGVVLEAAGALTFVLRSDNTTLNRIILTTSTTGYNSGAWQHCVWTYGGLSTAASNHVYINGSEVTLNVVTDNLSGTIVTTDPLWLGAANYGGTPGNYYAGDLDEVAVYDKALSLAEAQWVYNSSVPRDLYDAAAPSNLVAWWRAGEWDVPANLTLVDSGPSAVIPTVRDCSGNGRGGTTQNMVDGDMVTDSPGGVFARRSFQFDGLIKYVDMGNVLGYERNVPFSYSFWAKWTAAAYGMFVSKDNASNTGIQLYHSNIGTVTFVLQGSGGGYLQKGSTLSGMNDGVWRHFVVTYDGSSHVDGVNIWVNGVDVTGVGGANTLSTSIVVTDAFKLGRNAAGGGNHYGGRLDEVAVYSKKLSASEVAWIYNSGAPRSLRGVGVPSSLDAWWRLGEGAYQGTLVNMETTDFTLGGPAGVDGLVLPEGFYSDDLCNFKPGVLLGSTGSVGPTTVVYYKMRAQDSGASPPGYVTWVADTTPDFAGVGYSGATPTPVGSMVPGSAIVASSWEETA